MVFDCQPRRNSRTDHAAFVAEMDRLSESGSRDWNMRLDFHRDRVSLRDARLGWLKAAFLAAFAVYGYRFAFAPALRVVRQQINDPDAKLITLSGMIEPDASSERRLILTLDSPEPLAGAIAVVMGQRSVLLPGRANDTTFFERLPRFRQQAGADRFDWSGDVTPWPNRPMFLSDFQDF